MTIAPGQRIVATADSAGRLVAIPVNSPTPGQRVVSVAASTGKSVAIPVTSPTPGQRIVAIPGSLGKLVAVYSGAGGPTPPAGMWTARYGHAAVTLSDGSIVLMGGSSGGSEVWRSTNNGLTWIEQTASASWGPRSEHTASVMTDGSIILTGGYSPSIPGVLNDVWRSTDKGVTWIQRTASAPWAVRMGHSAIVGPTGTLLYIMAGNTPSGTYYNDVWVSSDYGATWTEKTPSAGWSIRTGACAAGFPDGSFVLTCGGYYEYFSGSGGYWELVYYNDTWNSTDQAVTWVQQSYGFSGTKRAGAAQAILSDGSLVVLGGLYTYYSAPPSPVPTYDYLNDVWRTANEGSTWTSQSTSLFPARSQFPALGMADGSLIILGGGTATGALNDVWRSTDKGVTWTQIR